jgi:uncharacterized membrane protein YkvA (DUF1232 family)
VLLGLFWLARPKGLPARDLLALVPETLRLIRRLIADPSVPADVRIVLVGLLLWLISPIDLIPDFIPVIGPIDDIVVAVAAIRYARRRIGSEELRRRWTGSDASFSMLVRVIGAG